MRSLRSTISIRSRADQARPERSSFSGAIILLALVLAGRSPALSPDRNLGEYTLATWDEELPQNTVLALDQTPDGYLWLGTYEGLARFDGLRFVVYDRRNTPALGGGNEIFDLAVDQSGVLWVASSTSLSKLEAGRFEQILDQDRLAGEPVRALAASDGGLWAGTPSRLFQLDGNGGLVHIWTTGEQVPNSVIRSLVTGRSGALWVGFESGELMRLVDGEIEIFGESEGLPARSVRALAQGADGGLWIGTMGAGLLHRLGNTVTRFGVEDGLADDKIRCLSVDSHGVLWIGTDGGGVSRYIDGRFSTLTSSSGLPSDLVRSLFQDREGGLWIGTNGGGVVALHEKKFSALDRRDGLRHDNVRAVLEDHSGAVWIGTDGGGLHRLRDQQLTHFGVEAGLTSDFVKSIHEDRRRRLWVGTGGGLNRFDGERFVSYANSEGLSSDIVNVIQDDSEGILWVGTNGGLKQLGPSERLIDFTGGQGLADVQVNDILESSRGELWVATVTGLHRVTPSEVIPFTAEDGLASSQVFSLFEDSDGTLWIGTNRGLSRFRYGDFQTVTSEDGLADDVIFTILDDGLERLWMSSNQGVFSVLRRELSEFLEGRVESVESTRYGRAHGMGAHQCNGTSQPAGWRMRDGRLLFPTVKGVAMVDPAYLQRNELSPPVVIEQMIVDSEEVTLTERISLEPNRAERIEFRYTGLSLHSPELVQFRHQLLGFDGDWVAVGNRRVAQYTKIPPGRYRFRVIAANGDGVWNEVGDSIGFEIRPFFYQTRWFPWAMGLLLLGLGWSAHRWQLLRVEAQRQQLALLVEARTEELEAANRELQRLSVTDSLTGTANRRRFDQSLEEEWMRACRQREPVSLLMVDIDFFKRYNDTRGHQEGDEVLKRVAVELQASARRAGDLVARYGGEEFAILVPRMDSEEAERFAEQVRRRVEGVAIPHPSSLIGDGITVSVGAATLHPNEGGSTEELVLRADQALYSAKRRGRNRIALAGSAAFSESPSSRYQS